jgi:hypothetical protein
VNCPTIGREMSDDDDLQAVHEGFLTTRGVRNDFKILADELSWVANMLPVKGSGDDP